MLQRLVDDLRTGAINAGRLTALVALLSVSMFVVIGFLSAAAFMFVLPREGAVAACFAGAAVFLIVALLALASHAIQRRLEKGRLERTAKEAAKSAKSTASTLLSDPAALAIGLQLVRIVGVRRLIPLFAIGGIALGILASRRDRDDGEATDDD